MPTGPPGQYGSQSRHHRLRRGCGSTAEGSNKPKSVAGGNGDPAASGLGDRPARDRRACRVSSAGIAVHARNGAANIPLDHEVDLLPGLEPNRTRPIAPTAIRDCEEGVPAGRAACRLRLNFECRGSLLRDITEPSPLTDAARQVHVHVTAVVAVAGNLDRRGRRFGVSGYAGASSQEQRRGGPPAWPAANSRGYGPTVTIFATEGTPAPLIRNSMYGPGGAKAPLSGATLVRVRGVGRLHG